jgi:hypothetical protein
VLQTGSVGKVFLRPANEAVARLLGAGIIGYGRAVAPDCIDAGDGVRLAEPTAEQARDLYGGVQSSLRSCNGKSGARVGEGVPMRWKIIS